MRLSELFVATGILPGGRSIGKPELIGQLVSLLVAAGHLPAEEAASAREAVVRREGLGSTGIGRGIAIPHARHRVVSRRLGVLALCREPVEFDALDAEPVDLLILILAPFDRPGTHLGEASRGSEVLFRWLRDESFCARLRQAESAEEITAVLRTADVG